MSTTPIVIVFRGWGGKFNTPSTVAGVKDTKKEWWALSKNSHTAASDLMAFFTHTLKKCPKIARLKPY